MHVPTEHFKNIPVYTLSPTPLTKEAQELIQNYVKWVWKHLVFHIFSIKCPFCRHLQFSVYNQTFFFIMKICKILLSWCVMKASLGILDCSYHHILMSDLDVEFRPSLDLPSFVFVQMIIYEWHLGMFYLLLLADRIPVVVHFIRGSTCQCVCCLCSLFSLFCEALLLEL